MFLKMFEVSKKYENLWEIYIFEKSFLIDGFIGLFDISVYKQVSVGHSMLCTIWLCSQETKTVS